ncbi:MAG: rod shape-determining protein MreC [Solirubrobacterales bacterium]
MYRKQVRRRRAVLALLIVGSFALLTFTYGRGSNSVQHGVGAIFAPFQDAADRALKPARDMVNWFDKTFDAKGENDKLKSELAAARKEIVGAKAALSENRQLRGLVGLNQSGAIPSGYEPVAGRVTFRSPTVWFADVTIDVGSGDGVAVGDPVVNGDGPEGALVGEVSSVAGGSAQVKLIVDGTSAIGAKVVPLGIQGVISAKVGEPSRLILDFIDSTKPLHKGQDVVTSGWRGAGIEAKFPPNIPIGKVVKASILKQEAQQQVEVEPFAELRNLEYVEVLTGGSRK